VAVGATLLACLTNAAQAVPQEAELERRIDDVVQPYLENGLFSGVILVAEGDRVLLRKAYGRASDELNVPLRPDNRFKIASLSKQFTLAALARLMDAGRIRLDSRLSEFLPDFPRGAEITIGQLVNHQSGIPHTNDLPEFAHLTHSTLAENLAILRARPLDFTPGTRTSYSNGGYDVLAAVIERVSGMSYERYLRTAVLAPLALGSTGFARTYEMIPGLAEGYAPGDDVGARARARFYPSEIRIGGGGLYSSVDDVWRLFRVTHSRRFASEATSSALFRIRRGEITGRAPGYVAIVFVDVAADIYVVSLSNYYSALDGWGQRLYRAAVGRPYPTIPIQRQNPAQPGPELAGYFGRYQPTGGTGSVRIYRDGDNEVIFDDVTNDWRAALMPLQDGSFFHPFFDAICRFAETGGVKGLNCHSTVPASDTRFEFSRIGDLADR
jgi:CubicO group peptidase (beta-lactamase class C family)